MEVAIYDETWASLTSTRLGCYNYSLGPGGAWVDVPSGLGLEALAPGHGQACETMRPEMEIQASQVSWLQL